MALNSTFMDSPSHSDYAPQKRKRPSSRSSDSSNEPPSTRRRSKSPSALSPGPSVTKNALNVPTLEPKTENDSNAVQQNQKEGTLRAEFAKLLNTRSGGVYIPPARLRAMQQAASTDKSSAEYQRLSWDALRKSITGIVNRVNVANIKLIIPELFAENLIRGRGLFARSVMKAQAASLPFTPVFAALVAIINTKLPQVGELVVTRLVSQFRRSFKRNDKTVCHSTTTFLAHLVNQAVANEMIVLQILVLLLERPTDDSIEIAVGLTREVGAFLTDNSPKSNNIVFGRFRDVLNEGRISHRVQYMIEVLMQVRKDKYKDNPIIPEGLDLVEEEEQITHHIHLEEELQVQEGLNIFKFDSNYLENEEKYMGIKAEILGEEPDEGSASEEESEEEEDEVAQEKEGIEDRTETNLVNLRRVIYLTIMNALNYEEAVHKLLKVHLQEGEEIELVKMIIECCSQERSYSNFYGLVGERFSKLNRVWTDCFEQAFSIYYTTIHRYETNRLRNIARFFGYLFASDALSWVVMECIKINEDDTTSSSRIFVKIMMQEMMESMGLKNLADRFKDPEIKHGCAGMFPMDIPKNTRFSINYFTSIGLGALTEEMREYLQNAPKLILEQRRAMLEAESSSSDSDSSDSDTDSDSSEGSSSTDDIRRDRRDSRTPSHSRSRPKNGRRSSFRSISRSRTPSPRRPATDSSRRMAGGGSRASPMNRRSNRPDVSRSRSPPPRHRERARSPIPSTLTRRDRGDKDMDADDRQRSSRHPRSPSPLRHADDRHGRGTYDYDRKRRPSPMRDEPSSSHTKKYEARVARDRSPPPHMMRSGRNHESGRRYEEKERPSGRQRSPPGHGKERGDDAGRNSRR